MNAFRRTTATAGVKLAYKRYVDIFQFVCRRALLPGYI